MSKRSYHPSSRSSSLLKINNPNLVSASTKVMKSKSYLAKLRDKKNRLEQELLPNNYFASEELTEKPSVYSEKSVFKSDMSFEQKPSLFNANHEEILNILRLENPKAELRSSPKIYSSRYPSPSKNNQMTSEKCEEIEKELKIQKNKYKKLETQYNELLNKNAHIEMFYKDILENLKSELENSQSEEKIDPVLGLIGKDIIEIKNKLHELEIKSAVIEEKIRNK